MNTPFTSAIRSGMILSVAGASLLLTTACGGSNSTTPAASPPPSIPVSAQSDTGTASTTTSATTTTTATETTTASSTASSTGAPTASSGSASSSAGHVIADNPDNYRFDRMVAFTSPTGTLHCGLGPDANGCQSFQKVTNLPQCDHPSTDKGPIVWFHNGRVVAECVSQGVFSAPQTKALPYGHSLTVGGITCTSQPTGMYCINNSTHQSLFASRGYFGVGR